MHVIREEDNLVLQFKEYDNGLKFIFDKDNINDLCVINIFYPITMAVEKNNKGIGSFVLGMLFKGTNNRTAEEIAFEMESNCIQISQNRAQNYINISVSFEKKNFVKAMDLFFDILLNPKFDSKEIEKFRVEILSALISRNDNISNICADKFLSMVYDEKDYKSWLCLGAKDNITLLASLEIREFHENYIKKIAPIISFSGNIEYEQIYENLLAKFEGMTKLETNHNNEFLLSEIADTRYFKYKFNQAYIMQGFNVPTVTSDNFVYLKFINNYLGTGMSSILFTRIREEMGLVYEIGATHSSYNDINYWFIYLGLDNKNITRALNAITNELLKFVENGIPEQEIEIIKQRFKMNEILKKQKRFNRSFLHGIQELLGLGFDYDMKYILKINRISKQDIDENINLLFRDRNYKIAIIQ